MAKITLFTAPKPFTNPHIALIQRNAILSWKNIHPDTEVLLIGNEEGMKEFAHNNDIRIIEQVERNEQNTPLVGSIFEKARQATDSPLLAYVNADVILTPSFFEGACQAAERYAQFLIIGQRWDLAVDKAIDYSPNITAQNGEGMPWLEELKNNLKAIGRRHPRGGSDYFIFPRQLFVQIPALAIGRAGWDNWMIYESRRRGWKTIDASNGIDVIHQDHDYSHLPGGQPHYRLPESSENMRLAGGARAIYTLLDANCELNHGIFSPPQYSWKKFWREVEIFPDVTLHATWMSRLLFMLFHPKKAYHFIHSKIPF